MQRVYNTWLIFWIFIRYNCQARWNDNCGIIMEILLDEWWIPITDRLSTYLKLF